MWTVENLQNGIKNNLVIDHGYWLREHLVYAYNVTLLQFRFGYLEQFCRETQEAKLFQMHVNVSA